MTYPESLGDLGSKKVGEFQVVGARHTTVSSARCRLKLKDEIVADVGGANPYDIADVHMSIASFE